MRTAHRVLDVLAHKLGGGPRLLEVARQHWPFACPAPALAYSALSEALYRHSLFSAESQCPIVESVAEELDKAIHGAGAKLRSLFLGGSGSLHDTMDAMNGHLRCKAAHHSTNDLCRDRRKYAALLSCSLTRVASY